ncbi:hypothetical protein CCYA_CCYA12G3255 [Cyanidiococcus yangmingshanensis]|nr:hypothetical protein CCYA_CCYA12G3255 [Cyanidiococcus yangmingshanensis]
MRGVAAATPEARGRRSTSHARASVEFSPVVDDMTLESGAPGLNGYQGCAVSSGKQELGHVKGSEPDESASTPVKRYWWSQSKLENETCLTSPVTSVLLGGTEACVLGQAGGDALTSSPDLCTPHQGLEKGRTPRAAGRVASASRASKRRSGCRQDCSLFKLTHRFLELVFKTNDGLLDLNSVAERLGVKKRRIYDITNVLEGVGIIEKQGKNHIRWKGMVDTVPASSEDNDSGAPAGSASRRKRGRSVETRADERSSVDLDENQAARGADLAADQEILRLREQLVELERMDRLLDEQVRVLRGNLRRLSTSEKVMRYAYLTDEDILSLSVFQKHMVIAVQAPPGTELLWGDEPTRKQNLSSAAVYRLQVRSSGGAIECYLLSAGAGSDAQRSRCAMLSSSLPETNKRNGCPRGYIQQARASNGTQPATDDWSLETAVRRRALPVTDGGARSAASDAWRVAAGHSNGSPNGARSKPHPAAFGRSDVSAYAVNDHRHFFADRYRRLEPQSAASMEETLHADAEEFEMHSQTYVWGAEGRLSAPGSPVGSERALETGGSIIGVMSPLRSTVAGPGSPNPSSAAAYFGQDGIRPVPMRTLFREWGNTSSSWSNVHSTDPAGADYVYAADSLDSGIMVRSAAGATAFAVASSPERTAAALVPAVAYQSVGLDDHSAAAGPNTHTPSITTKTKDDIDASHASVAAFAAANLQGRSPAHMYSHSSTSGDDVTDDFHGEVMNLRRQQERGQTLHPGTVSPGGTLKLRRASPYASPLRDGSQRFSPLRRTGPGMALHLDYDMEGGFGSMLPCVTGVFTRSPSPPIIQDFAVESLLLDHTRERGGGLMDLFVSAQHDAQGPLS